jgi:ribonuclease VapC
VIVVDSSAIVAFLRDEPEAQVFKRAMATSDQCVLSTFTLFETGTVLLRRAPGALSRLDRLVADIPFELAPFDKDQARLSRDAYRRFGKGFHRAALNLGDCVSYALAKSLDAPLLFKGDDFTKTDVRSALA